MAAQICVHTAWTFALNTDLQWNPTGHNDDPLTMTSAHLVKHLFLSNQDPYDSVFYDAMEDISSDALNTMVEVQLCSDKTSDMLASAGWKLDRPTLQNALRGHTPNVPFAQQPIVTTTTDLAKKITGME